MKIGVIHANVSAAAPLQEAFFKADPNIKVINFCNEALLQIVSQEGDVTKEALRMFTRFVFEAADAGVDGIMIACSVYCAYANLIQKFLDVPVIAVDAPAIDQIAKLGGKVGILATTPQSAPACMEKLEAAAEKTGQKLSYEYGISEEALSALKNGRPEEHDRLIREVAVRLIRNGCETLFLSQITMARAAAMLTDLGVRVISTPDEGVKKLLEIIKKAGDVNAWQQSNK